MSEKPRDVRDSHHDASGDMGVSSEREGHTGPGQDERFVVSSFAHQIARIEAGLVPPDSRSGLSTRGGNSSMCAMSCKPMRG